jgi:hypothetical protein
LGVEALEDRAVPATFTVMNTADSGPGSLRQAIADAETAGGAELINFDTSGVFATAQTITLTTGQLNLTDPTGTLAIQGPSAGLSISGNSASRVFYLGTGGTATLQNLTVTGGKATGAGTAGYGGGVLNNGLLGLTNCTVSGNTSTDGGGVENVGGAATLTLTNCTLSGNTASGNGGGVLNQSGTATLTNCTLTGNSATTGGGVVDGGTLTLTNCTVTGNSAAAAGGVYVNGAGTRLLTNSIVAGNTVTNTATASDIGGTVAAGSSNNVIGAGGSGGLTQGPNGNQVGVTVAQLALSPLRDYGGPTQTFALLSGSRAIDAVPANTAGTPATDQRGVARTTTVATDVGAFQSVGVTLEVNLTGDAGVPAVGGVLTSLTLRENVNLAGISTGAYTVNFDPNVFATARTIVLTQGQIDLTKAAGATGSLTVNGTGANLLSVSGNNASRVFYLGTGGTAALQNLTVTGGKATGAGTAGYGGGVYNKGTLTLTNCTVSGNSAVDGGGALNRGTLNLTDCTLSGNSATGNGGGAFSGAGGALSLTNCTLSGNSANSGGGVYVNGAGSVSLTNCTVSGNSATGNGGGVHNANQLSLTNSIVAGNAAPTTGDINGNVVAGASNNVIGTGGSGGLTNTNGNQVGVTAAQLALAPLANNGGQTQTIALLPGSPALGGVPANAPNTPATDQRGFARTITAATDVGAFQTQPTPPTQPTQPTQPTPAPAPPAISAATIVNGGASGTFLMLTGPSGTQFLAVPQGATAFVTDVNGDGVPDVVVMFSSKFIVVLNGQTGRLFAVVADLTGGGGLDILLFSPAGTPRTLIVGKTGMEISLGG